MRKLVAAIAVCLALVTGAAQAPGPSRPKTGQSVTLNTTPAEVWAQIGRFAGTADGRRILVANWSSDTAQAVDTATLALVATLDVSAGRRAFGNFIAGVPADW